MNRLGEPTSGRRSRYGDLLCMTVLILFYGSGGFDPLIAQTGELPDVQSYGYRVVESYPHDPDAFTQGLLYHGGDLYESTGRLGESSLRRVDLESGDVMKIHRLPEDLFGEGLALWEDRLIQITYSSGLGFVYDRETFREIRRFRYEGEGWGLTHNGTHLILSDGSATLRYLDPVTFELVRRVEVTESGEPVDLLNELEMVGDRLYANVLFSEEILMIDPESGEVTGRIDLRGLLIPAEQGPPPNVLNGIAWDRKNDRLFVTGKLWPRLFEIELVSTP
ncbi:MAG: glutaminyl-peptide cyclotransferase [Bacteroidota bacterium]